MASRRINSEACTPVKQTRITTRLNSAKEPRDERVRLPKPVNNRRPTPLDIELAQSKAPLLTAISPLPETPLIDSEPEVVRDPEVVDLAAPKTWSRRDASLSIHRSGSWKRGSPSVKSRQSEMSFGILDYYIRDPSPIQSPELLNVPTPVVDPAIERFDFGLQRKTPPTRDAKPGADAEFDLIPLSPRPIEEPKAHVCQPQHKKTYSLFPSVKENSPTMHRFAQVVHDSPAATPTTTTKSCASPPQSDPSWRRSILSGSRLDSTPARRRAQTINTPSPAEPTLASRIAGIQTHQQPNASYRPRKESLTGSIRSRKDSCASQYGRRIPMRIISSSSKTDSRSSASTSTASPHTQLRWSDDTITSPIAATTPGPRTSFGSLLEGRGSGSGTYPACFFEDEEDEEAPLRGKSGWKRSLSLTQEQRGRKARGRFEERRGFGRVVRMLLCGCGG